MNDQSLELGLVLQINDLVDRFEQAIKKRNPVSIEELGSAIHAESQLDWLHWIIPVEMEYQWTSEHARKHSDSERSTVEHYVNRFPRIAEADELICRLIKKEFELRLLSDACADIVQFESRFPSKLDRVKPALQRMLHKFCPMRIVIYEYGRPKLAVPISATMRLGRATTSGIFGKTLEASETGKVVKIAIAEAGETRVSRKHALLEPIALRKVRLTPISAKSETIVDQTKLTRAKVVDVPCNMVLGSVYAKIFSRTTSS